VRGEVTDVATGRRGRVALVTAARALFVRPLAGSGRGHRPAGGVSQVATSSDGRRIVAAGDGGVRTGRFDERKLRRLRPREPINDVSVASGGAIAAIAGRGDVSGVRRWDARGRPLPRLDPPAFRRIGWSAAISAGGRMIAAGYWDGAVVLWRGDGREKPRGIVLGTHREPVTDLAFDSKDTSLASADSGGTIAIWDPEKRGARFRLTGHTQEVTSLAFSPDGRMLASASRDGSVRLWDPRTGRQLAETLRLGEPVKAVAFTPDGRALVTAHGAVTVWDASLWGTGDGTLHRITSRLCTALADETGADLKAACRAAP